MEQHNVFQLAELLYDRLIGGHRIEDIWDGTTEIVEDLPTIRKYDFKIRCKILCMDVITSAVTVLFHM